MPLASIGKSVGAWFKMKVDALRAAKERADRAYELARAPEAKTAGFADDLEYEWYAIQEGNVRFWVFADAAKINGVRINVTAAEAQAIADDIGASLTTPKIEDLIYKHATIKIPPFPSDVVKTTASQHSAKIDQALKAQKGLISTVGKSWVLSNKLSESKAMNYGWHTLSKPASSGPWPSVTLPGVNVFQQPGTAHNPAHEDYSQTLRLVHRKVVVGDKIYDLHHVLKEPGLAELFSHEGALKLVRQPVKGSTSPIQPVDYTPPAPGEKITHASARAALIEAFKKVFNREPTLREAQFAQAVSLGESGYGQWAFTNRVTGEKHYNTWNMGAVQCGQRPPCPEGCFEATDTDSTGKPYQACFRKYATPAEGFEHFLKVLYINRGRHVLLDAANKGDIANFSTLMRKSGYFELALNKHIAGMRTNLGIITKALNEPMPTSSGGSSGAGPIIGLALLGITIAAVKMS